MGGLPILENKKLSGWIEKMYSIQIGHNYQIIEICQLSREKNTTRSNISTYKERKLIFYTLCNFGNYFSKIGGVLLRKEILEEKHMSNIFFMNAWHIWLRLNWPSYSHCNPHRNPGIKYWLSSIHQAIHSQGFVILKLYKAI